MKHLPYILALLGLVGSSHAALPGAPGGIASGDKPDITTHGFTLNGQFISGGPIVELDAAKATSQSQGKCTFTMNYHMKNGGEVKTSPAFKNVVKLNNQTVKVHSGQVLNAGENKQLAFAVSLSGGMNNFEIFLDDGNAVNESKETNNYRIGKVKIVGNCGGNAPSRGGMLTPNRVQTPPQKGVEPDEIDRR